MVEYVHGQTGKFCSPARARSPFPLRVRRDNARLASIPAGSSPAVLLHDSICTETANNRMILAILYFCMDSYFVSDRCPLFLPGSDFRSIVKPEAYGYFHLVLVFDGDSVLVHKIRQFDGFIANLAAAVRQF